LNLDSSLKIKFNMKRKRKILYLSIVMAFLFVQCKKETDIPQPKLNPVVVTPKTIFEVPSRDKFSIGDFDNPYLFKIEGVDLNVSYPMLKVLIGVKNFYGITTLADDGNEMFLGFREIDIGFPAWSGISDGARVTFTIVIKATKGNVALDSVKINLIKTPINKLYTWRDVQNAKNNPNIDYQLQNDVTFPDPGKWGSRIYGFAPIGWSDPYNGIFDGEGYRLLNFPAKSSLVSYVSKASIVRNLTIEVGTATLNDVSAFSGTIAISNEGQINKCIIKGKIIGNTSYSTGGLVGTNLGSIEDCSLLGSVVSKNSSCGGLVGYNVGIVKKSFVRGDVSGDNFVGGIAGASENNGSIFDCFVIGSVSGKDEVGGIAGILSSATINNCYFAGTIVSGGFYVGTILGLKNSGILGNCYYENIANSSLKAIGTIDDVKGQAEGQNSVNMKNQNTYVGWDFVNAWSIDAITNNGYPYLH
jgi:hypothetical protein